MSHTPNEELTSFLSDMYSVELQALAQLDTAPSMAGEPGLEAALRTHFGETEKQAELILQRLEAHGGSPSAVKNAIMKLGGKGFLLFAGMQAETPGRLITHAYSYEAMEWAGYAVLIRMAELAGDTETAEVARSIQAEERTMMERLEAGFDAVEEVSHRDTSATELKDHVRKHLDEAHALETQSIKLLEKSADIAGDPTLSAIYSEHLGESRQQIASLEKRLDELGRDKPSLQDLALKLGALNWGLFFQAQSDTPAKLLAFAYAVEHLEIGAYELLRRTARRAADRQTEELCESILAEERDMTRRLADAVDLSVRTTPGFVSA